MKICLVGGGFHKRGGVERYGTELAEHFCKEHEVHIVASTCEHEISGATVHRIPLPSFPSKGLQNLLWSLEVAEYVKKLDEKVNFDIIHAGGVIPHHVVTAHSCHMAGVKIWNEFTRQESSYPRYLFYKLMREIQPANRVTFFLERAGVEKARKVIAVSRGVKKELMDCYHVPEDRFAIIPPGVNLKEFNSSGKKRAEIREKLGVGEDEIILIFVANEFKRKGLDRLILALPSVEAKLLVVGKDDPSPYIYLSRKMGVLNKVIFAGKVPRVEEYYMASDIFVLPTMYEAFPAVSLEASAASLPLLVTKVNGAEELIREGYNGFFITRDPKDITEKLRLLVEDEKLRKLCGKRARKVAENYSWDKIAKRVMEVYEEIAKR